MSDFLDPVKSAFREAVAESQRKSEDERIKQAFRNGIVIGLMLSVAIVSVVWAVAFLFKSS